MWEPRVGDLVGRGPGWRFKDQGVRCDFGVVVEVCQAEVLIRWRVSADHISIVRLLNISPGQRVEDRIFRYTFGGQKPEVVSWAAFLRARTLQPSLVSVKLEELLLMGAILGVLCNQKDCVLPCFQFQTVECMLALVDVQPLTTSHNRYKSALADYVSRQPVYREAVEAEERIGPDADPNVKKSAAKRVRDAERSVMENDLPFDAALSALEGHFRSQRELAARGLWVLNALLQHKKLALVFLERNGLERVLQVGQSTSITSILYGCSLIMSQLARPAVLEEVLQRHTPLFTPAMTFAMRCLDHPCADIKGSAAAFFFHALSFPLVLMHFDANGGLAAALRLFKEVVAINDETHDIVNPTLCLVMLRGFGTYLSAHMLLHTRVLFAEHRSLASVLHRPATSALPTRDASTIEVITTILTSPTETAMRYLTGVLPETLRRVTGPTNVHAFRDLVDKRFHSLLLKCVAFYREQDRFDLLIATLNVLKLFATFPFTRKAIALCDEQQQQSPFADAPGEEGTVGVEVTQAARRAPPVRPSDNEEDRRDAAQEGTGASPPPSDSSTHGVVSIRSVPILLLVMEDLSPSNRESVQAVVGALQVLLLLLSPPRDSSDETGAMVFTKVCAAVRANDGIRVLLDLLRPRTEGSGAGAGSGATGPSSSNRHVSSTNLALFPVVAHVVHILVQLVSNPGSDTPLLFRALDVHRIVKDVLQTYVEVPRMYSNKVVMHRHDVPINISLSRFVEHAKCLVMGHIPTQAPLFTSSSNGPAAAADASQRSSSPTAAAASETGGDEPSFAARGASGAPHPSRNAGGPTLDDELAVRQRGGSPPIAAVPTSRRPDLPRHDETLAAMGPVSSGYSPLHRTTAEGGHGHPSSSAGPLGHDNNAELLSDPFEVMERQDIVSRSTLRFTRPSLIKLISSYLRSEGLLNAAEAVEAEALCSKKLVAPAESTYVTSEVVAPSSGSVPESAAEAQTLPGLVKSYLRYQQSALSMHPIATLPPFDLSAGTNLNFYSRITDVTRRQVGRARNVITRMLKRKEGLTAFRRCQAYDHDTFYDSHRFLFDVRGANDDELSALSITFCDDGATIAIGTSEGGIALFDTSSGEDVNGSGEKLLEQHIIFEDGGVVDVVASPNQELIAAVRDLTATTDGGGSLTQLMRRDSLPSSILSIPDCRTVRFAEHHDNFLVGTMDTASKCVLYDLNRADAAQVFTDSDMPYASLTNFRNVASLDATGNLVLSDATMWDRRCPTRPLVHFDRITEHFSCQFHPNNRHVIIDKGVWDLRTLSMLFSCAPFHQASVQSFDYGSRLAAFQEPDYTRSSSIVSIVDGQTYEAIRTLDMKPMLRSFAVSKTGVLFAGIQDSETEVSVRIYSFGMEADEERFVAESEEPVDDDDLDGSDSELDMDDDDMDEMDDESDDDDDTSSASYSGSSASGSGSSSSSSEGGDNEEEDPDEQRHQRHSMRSSPHHTHRWSTGRRRHSTTIAAAPGGGSSEHVGANDNADTQSDGAMST